jgi:hypothetical protein
MVGSSYNSRIVSSSGKAADQNPGFVHQHARAEFILEGHTKTNNTKPGWERSMVIQAKAHSRRQEFTRL